MKVHILKKQTIENYVKINVQARTGFETWLSVLKASNWIEPSDIVSSFNTADILGKGTNRVVFNIGGNKYRVICTYHFGIKKIHLFINWIGTHASYDKLCKKELQFTISSY